LEKCNTEVQDDAAGMSPDWDGSMIAVAIYRAMVAAAPSGGWQDISTEPKGGHLAHWVADPRGYMEPVHEKYGRWRNCYSGLYITWAPTLWMPLPEAPVGSGRTRADATPTSPQPILYGAPKQEEG
jgi:hypothetical protein